MSLVETYFSAATNARMEPTDVYLPLPPAPLADLLNILSDPESYAILTLKNDRYIETVKARNERGTIILERALEGTEAVLHPFGTCVSTVTPTVMAVIKDLICNYTCCQGDCPCIPVSYVGAVLPVGHVAQAWQGSVIFSGDLPMTCGVSNLPSWASAKQQGNAIIISGTPSSAGVFNISASATNCNGTELATQALTINIEI